MNNTATPQLEPEAKGNKLYTDIIDLCNKEADISLGEKMFTLAKVVKSIEYSVEEENPGVGKEFLADFIHMLIKIGAGVR